jgi:hypothetical protein
VIVGDADLEMYELAGDQPESEPLPDTSRRRWYRFEWAMAATIALWGLAAAGANRRSVHVPRRLLRAKTPDRD